MAAPKKMIQLVIPCLFFTLSFNVSFGQFGNPIKWSSDGNGYYRIHSGNISLTSLPDNKETVLVSSDQLSPKGSSLLSIESFSFSRDNNKILLYTNSKKVWRYKTRGDYWVYDLRSGSLIQLGKTLPKSSLMFAKISPDGNKAAYVSEHNLYVEDLSSN
ncbi:MAG TPA: DPP IV N-terminal domain-containing protein, partial [Puia sp.]|nr:DPP IV N-terminal domain-containing protein [Puia sp.]